MNLTQSRLIGTFVLLFVLFSLNLVSVTLETGNVDEAVAISSFLMNGKGEFFLLSPRQGLLLKFTPKGKFEKMFAGKGQGPGEVNRVLRMFHNPMNDYLYLPEFQSGTRGIHVFDSDGRFKGKLKIGLEERKLNKVWSMLFRSDGSCFVLTSRRVKWKPYGKLFLTQNEVSIEFFDKKGKKGNIVFKELLDDEVSNQIRYGGPRILFKPAILTRLTPGGDIGVGKSDENTIYIYNHKGTLVKKVSLEISREKLTDKEFETARDNYVERLKTSSNERMAPLARQMPKLEFKPIYDNVFLSSDYIVLEQIIKEDEYQNALESRLIFFDWKGKKVKDMAIDGYVDQIMKNTLLIKRMDQDGNEIFEAAPIEHKMNTNLEIKK